MTHPIPHLHTQVFYKLQNNNCLFSNSENTNTGRFPGTTAPIKTNVNLKASGQYFT